MRSKKCLLIAVCGLVAASCAADEARFETQGGANGAGPSVIKSESDITPDPADWGTFYPYFTEATHALDPVLVGVAKISAGQHIHPPHRHADEEYLMVTKGRGIWYLNGEETEAVEGDILFARAWDYHGIRAADDSPLEFVVFKYGGRHIDEPADPQPSLPELLEE